MALRRRISLRAHEDSIRGWVSEGKNDAWIASALGTSPGSVQSFRSRRSIPRGWSDQHDGRRSSGKLVGPSYEGAVERAEDGRVGIWFDPAVSGDSCYRMVWAQKRSVIVRVVAGRIVLEGR